jgi:hypothetical protein
MAMLRIVAKANGGEIGQGWNLIVLHHTDCGITCLAHFPELLAKHFGVAPGDLDDLAIADRSVRTRARKKSAHQNPPGRHPQTREHDSSPEINVTRVAAVYPLVMILRAFVVQILILTLPA